MRIEGDASQHTFALDLLNDAVQVGAGFVVHIHHMCAQGLDLVNKLLGLHNHQVDIEGFLGVLGHGLHDGKSEGNVGHKHTVHHVKMKPVALAAVEHFDVAL